MRIGAFVSATPSLRRFMSTAPVWHEGRLVCRGALGPIDVGPRPEVSLRGRPNTYVITHQEQVAAGRSPLQYREGVPVVLLVCAVAGAALGPAFSRAVAVAPTLGPAARGVRRRSLPARPALCAALGAIAFVGMGQRFGATTTLVPHLVLAAAVVPLALIDIEHHRLPDCLVLPSLAIAALAIAAMSALEGEPGALARALLGMILYAGTLIAAALLFPAGLGLGDVKLGLLLGLVLGWNSLQVVAGGLLLGTLCGAALALAVAAIARTRTAEIPYGPALCLGALVAVVWPEQLGLV